MAGGGGTESVNGILSKMNAINTSTNLIMTHIDKLEGHSSLCDQEAGVKA